MSQIISMISCHGYRGFEAEGVLHLAKPNGSYGSGLTVLIGPNGGGKSTIVESMRKLSVQGSTSFTEGKRNNKAGDRVSIKVQFNEIFGELKTVAAGGSEAEWVCAENRKPKLFFLPSRRVFNPYFGKGAWGRDDYTLNTGDFKYRGQSLDSFSHRLFKAQEKKDDFQPIFEKVYGKKLDWKIDQNDNGQYYVKVTKNNNVIHNSDGLGEGIVSLLFLVDALYESSEDELLIVDEPELSLHPQLQRRLHSEICSYAKSRQIVYATHSPEMVSIEAILGGARIARVVDENDGSKVYMLNEETKSIFESFESDLFNPHTFGYDSRSCLFAEDNIVITEGQEDVVFLKKLLGDTGQTYDLPFWGFGAGGSGRISKIAKILKELGFKKVGAVFDGDKIDEAKVFADAYPDYQCVVLPADDIRDKVNADGEVIKTGVYDSSKALKPEHQTECVKLLDELNEYINGKDISS